MSKKPLITTARLIRNALWMANSKTWDSLSCEERNLYFKLYFNLSSHFNYQFRGVFPNFQARDKNGRFKV